MEFDLDPHLARSFRLGWRQLLQFSPEISGGFAFSSLAEPKSDRLLWQYPSAASGARANLKTIPVMCAERSGWAVAELRFDLQSNDPRAGQRLSVKRLPREEKGAQS